MPKKLYELTGDDGEKILADILSTKVERVSNGHFRTTITVLDTERRRTRHLRFHGATMKEAIRPMIEQVATQESLDEA